ncbi:leucine rich repeat family protein [Stylonychia lemnae]|uniref:Leucine rich repeat family protein n=1 Tax=Stylonychia lemnae TaxID=5949 RepID=A0A078APU8_STYLE|nr:leucine rich repeat family protein [Stylonychia lemnae]|eukprot:CDW84189.1 leucine rich repeat family protein [Stylonychia lemnae]
MIRRRVFHLSISKSTEIYSRKSLREGQSSSFVQASEPFLKQIKSPNSNNNNSKFLSFEGEAHQMHFKKVDTTNRNKKLLLNIQKMRDSYFLQYNQQDESKNTLASSKDIMTQSSQMTPQSRNAPIQNFNSMNQHNESVFQRSPSPRVKLESQNQNTYQNFQSSMRNSNIFNQTQFSISSPYKSNETQQKFQQLSFRTRNIQNNDLNKSTELHYQSLADRKLKIIEDNVNNFSQSRRRTALKQSQHNYQKKKFLIEPTGIDMNTLKKDGFPQLIFENEAVVTKLFRNIEKDLDIKTHRLSFESFMSVVCSFRISNIEEKIERFFKLIDEDGNGFLSYDEIYNLCNRSFANIQDSPKRRQSRRLNKKEEKDDFFLKLSEYFTQYIFKSVNLNMDQEISIDGMKKIVSQNKDGADLLEMFCGEDNVKLCI